MGQRELFCHWSRAFIIQNLACVRHRKLKETYVFSSSQSASVNRFHDIMHGLFRKANFKQHGNRYRFRFGRICCSSCLHRKNQYQANKHRELNTYSKNNQPHSLCPHHRMPLAGYASMLWYISDRLAKAEEMVERRNLEPNPCISSKESSRNRQTQP